MEQENKLPVNIEDEMKRSYLDYAMSVIIGRALPDVRDGLKPVHRRVLWAMNELSNTYNKPYKKSARVVGDCFVKGTLVHTDRGITQIEHLQVNDYVRMPNGNTSRIIKTFYNPPAPVINVKLSNGNTLTVTPGQLFRVLRDDLTIGWERADKLTGQKVLVSNPNALKTPKPHPNQEMVAAAYNMGLLLAEDYVTDQKSSHSASVVMVGKEPLESLKRFESQEIKTYWSNIKPQEPHYKSKHVVQFNNWLAPYKTCFDTSENKQAPDWILSDRRLYAPFLAGFIDRDGYIRSQNSHGQIALVSISHLLIKQIQVMLGDSGIHCRHSFENFSNKNAEHNDLPKHTLFVTGNNASLFCQLIVDYLKIADRRKAANSILQNNLCVANTETDCLPGNTKICYSQDLLKKDLSYKHIESWVNLENLEKIDFPLHKRLNTLVNNYCIYQVEKVENLREMAATYDVQIEDDSHEFLVENISVHNCIGKYHPHGDVAVYDTIVRLAQDFSMRTPLIDGQGNFGCFTGKTKIKLVDGTEKSFEELAKLSPEEIFYVYSVDKNGNIVIGKGKHSRITRQQADLIELTLDNGQAICCTPDHLFMLRDGTYKEAKDLTPEDSLMPGYFDLSPVKKGLNTYLRVLQPKTGKYEFVHHLADKFNENNMLAKETQGAFVRHHKNFNRFDNNPDNIERLAFLEHLHLHAKQIKSLWQKEEFRENQKKAIQNYYTQNPEVLAERKERFISQNQNLEFRSQNGQRVSSSLKNFFQNNPQVKYQISERMKALWKDPDYRQKMYEALSNIEKIPLTIEQKERISKIISEKSKAMWEDESKKTSIIDAICQALSSQEVRAKISTNSKKNWQDPNYQAKYAKDHFSNMAKLLWQNPETRQKHSTKIAQQRQNISFVEAQRLAVQKSNKQRLLNNPSMMSDMAKLSAQSLEIRWKDPSYKQNIIRQKVARYLSGLIAAFGVENINPSLYESSRKANWIPNLQKALVYFQDFESMVNAGKTYNHRIMSKKFLEEKTDVYDITVDIHHNFLLADGVFVHNSVDGDAPAAMRYTEIRMAKVSDMMLADIDKETVDFHTNYDETMVEPVVLPARFPNLLVNGASGIAVGMATNIPPHNLTEILEATILLVQKPETPLEEILKIVPGPDFPTGAFIFGREGIKQAYETGRGSVIMRARAAIDRSTRNESRETIVVTQIPYQINKAKLIERIAELINEKKIEDISDLRDESDREGMRIVIELKRGAIAQVVLNNLYKLTAMQTSFGIINLAIVAGQPKVLGILETLRLFINFRKEVVRRRTEFELRKANARQHILLGLIKALDHLDEVIKLIRASRSSAEAKEGLVTKFDFSAIQAQAILDLQLHRLTGLEREKIVNELKDVERRIKELEDILNNESTLKTVIIKELREVQKDFGNERRTQILDAEADLKLEDLIPDEDMVITVTHSGYIKRTPLTHYRSQRRGGTGKKGMTTRAEDIVSHIFIASNHSYILIFSDKGQAYTLKVHEIPDVSASGKGKAIVNLINLPSTEKVAGILAIREFAKDQHVVMVTRRGTIKKTELADFAYSRARGILAIGIDEGDELIATELSDGKKKILIATHDGMAIYFDESDVRSMGRQAYGVKGIDLRDNDYVVGVAVVTGAEQILTVSQYGLGKRTTLEDYRFQSRGGVGVINMKVTDKTGSVVAVMPVQDDDELMLISSQGKVIRFDVKDIRETGRNTQGVRLIDTADEDYVASASLIERQDNPILETPEK